MEWFTWLGEIIKMVGDIIPRRILIEPTHRGIKYKGMTDIVVLNPGRYWYVPFFTTYYTIPITRQSIYTDEQDLTTKDGRPLKVRSVISYEVEDVKTALARCYEFNTQIDDETMGIICRYVARRDLSELQNERAKANREITHLVNERMNEYGISIKRVQFTSFITGKPLLLIGIQRGSQDV